MAEQQLEILEEIADVIGFRGAYRLSLMRAGTTFYLPQDPPPHHWLRRVLNDQEVSALAQRFGRDTMTIPPLPDTTRHKVEVALENNLAIRDIAMLTGKSERYVYRVKEDMVAEPSAGGDS